ncbi:S1 RNA-binding domain-containing protein [Candidatus Margulisiibacteriota bacterium]
MAEELKATSLDKSKGQDEFLEVEDLIKETLAETKVLEKKEAPPTPQPEPKKDEFTATKISLPRPTPAPEAPKSTAAPSPAQPKTEDQKYEATFREYKVGDIVKGKVIKVDQGGVLVDINYKADGLVLAEELSEKTSVSPKDIVKVGDVMDVFIENLENKEGYVVLSKKHADYEKRWRLAYDSYKGKKVLEGKVMQALKGGLVVECEGIRGFIPASQVRKQPGESLEAFKGKTLPVKVIDINRRQGKIVLSHKMAAGEKKNFEASKILDEIEVGQVRPGTVTSLKSFGAFVNIGGIEGLIHLSELSWKRVKHPSVLLKVGQELDVFVLGVDKVNKKVALGLKELQPDPWENAAEYFKPGQIIKAKIVRFAKFGAFAEIDHDLEGLIHNTELGKEPVFNPGDAVKIGDTVDVKVLRVLPDEQKIGLSIKEVILQKEKGAAKKSAPAAEKKENKVTIGDMIAQKEKERAEKEEEEEEQEQEQEKAS